MVTSMAARHEGRTTVQREEVDLIAAVAHELRAPLATLRASLELLEEIPTLCADDAMQLVCRLQRSVTWMDGLIQNFATWSAVETGRLSPRRAEINILDCIEPASTLVQPLLDRKQQRVRVTCPRPAPRVAGDALQLRQVLVNLLLNAGAYSPPGADIDLVVAITGAAVQVRVVDRGPGIARSEQRRIFERYVRGAAGQCRPMGQGLGLHIVKTLVEVNGGTVGVSSTPGRGATFWFRLPRVGAMEFPALMDPASVPQAPAYS